MKTLCETLKFSQTKDKVQCLSVPGVLPESFLVRVVSPNIEKDWSPLSIIILEIAEAF